MKTQEIKKTVFLDGKPDIAKEGTLVIEREYDDIIDTEWYKIYLRIYSGWRLIDTYRKDERGKEQMKTNWDIDVES